MRLRRAITSKKFLIACLLLILSGLALASAPDDGYQIDASTTFLNYLFGVVSGVFYENAPFQAHRSGLDFAFEFYNKSISIVGVVIILYISIIALVNSAHSGQAMGQKWHTLFLPLRISLGAGLLFPNVAGYNIAQVFIMWLILHGTSWATMLWDKVYTDAYFQYVASAQKAKEAGDLLVNDPGFRSSGNGGRDSGTTPGGIGAAEKSDAKSFFASIGSIAACAATQRLIDAGVEAAGDINSDDFIKDVQNALDKIDKDGQVEFDPKDGFGTRIFTKSNKAQLNDAINRRMIQIQSENVDDFINRSYNYEFVCADRFDALDQNDCDKATAIIPKDGTIAQRCTGVKLEFQPGLASKTARADIANEIKAVMKQFAQDFDNYVIRPEMSAMRASGSSYLPDAQSIIGRIKLNALREGPSYVPDSLHTYVKSIIDNYAQDQQDQMNENLKNKQYELETNLGWIYAGATYHTALKATGPIMGSAGAMFINYLYNPTIMMSESPLLDIEVPAITYSSGSGVDFGGSATTTVSVNDYPHLPYYMQALMRDTSSIDFDSFTSPRQRAAASIKAKFDTPDAGGGWIKDILSLGMNKLIPFVVDKILDPDELFGYDTNVNVLDVESIAKSLEVEPLRSVSGQGQTMTNLTEYAFFAMIALLVAAGIAAALLPGLPYVLGAAAIFVPVLAAAILILFLVLALFYPIGIIMQIYIPIIPFMIFTFGVVGWFMICIEAMAAGPLMAIGLMHPDGNEVIGKAEKGLMLLLNLMLRPILMIIGLIAGVLLVRVVLLFFATAMNLFLDSGAVNYSSLGGAIGMLFIYIGMISTIVQKCFSLINIVPDKVMTWIGEASGNVGEATEWLQTAKGEAEKGSNMPGKMVSAGKSGLAGGMKAGQSAIKPTGGPGGGKGGLGE